MEGKLKLRFSIPWLARGVGLCGNSVRWAVRRLIARGVLRLVGRSKAGHVVEVRLPAQVPAVSVSPIFTQPLCHNRTGDFEDLDLLKHPALRRAGFPLHRTRNPKGFSELRRDRARFAAYRNEAFGVGTIFVSVEIAVQFNSNEACTLHAVAQLLAGINGVMEFETLDAAVP